ncbi:O-antigen acetylase [hydrothermal vent metagenome]|uniref:O-antigen acetylase n=1 Tax=hydrothermal vent metagenome TaxID=652676 RepID=A0A3B0WVT5_9ZZZZ
MPQMNISKSINYRPDIDGLRAIAVLFVVGFHTFPSRIPGGFTGVDVFFVISGFLISTIILGNFEKNSFSYREFYYRRIKRIFPALLLVITTVWLLGWFMLFPDEFEQLGKHMVGGIGFVSNIILWNEAGYFDNSSETKPLLHLWSLGIEEQFYIIWPIVLGLVWKNRVNALGIIISIAILSFILNIYSVYNFSSSSSFYLPFNRFWELMVGGVLGYIQLHHTSGTLLNKLYSNVFSILGCVMIAMAFTFVDGDKLFPGWWALLPALGAFFIILSPGSWINHNILANRIFVYIGLISYPLYLWHWPILSFAHILEFTATQERLIAVGLSLVLAILTYELIEKKVKNNLRFIYILVLMALLLLFLGLFTFNGSLPPRNNTYGIGLSIDAISDWEYPKELKKIKVNDIDMYIKTGTKEKVLYFGDSHLQQYSPRIVKLINEDPANTKSVVFATKGGCPPIPGVFEDQHPRCNASFRKTVIKYALSNDIDSVVIGANWGYLNEIKRPPAGEYRYYFLQDGHKKYFDVDGIEYAFQSLENLILSISKYKKVYLLLDNPIGLEFDPKTFFKGSRISGYIEKKEVTFYKYNKKQLQVRARLLELAKKTDVIIIDPDEHFCVQGRCKTSSNDGTPIYKDFSHIRSRYVKEFVEYLDVTVMK